MASGCGKSLSTKSARGHRAVGLWLIVAAVPLVSRLVRETCWVGTSAPLLRQPCLDAQRDPAWRTVRSAGSMPQIIDADVDDDYDEAETDAGVAASSASAAGGMDRGNIAEYVLPVGPACPFRSPTLGDRDIELELAAAAQEATGKLSALASMQLDRELAKTQGLEIAASGLKFKELLDFLEASDDFQLVETYHVMERTARRNGVPSLRALEMVVSWQAACILAMGEGLPQPPQPAGLDLKALQGGNDGDSAERRPSSSSSAVQVESGLARMPPFSGNDFDKLSERPGVEALKTDFENLVQQHKALVQLGESFGSFDSGGKEMYISQMRDISSRWAALMRAAQEAGVPPSTGYGAYSHEYLKRARLSRAGFRELMAEVHEALQSQVAVEAA
eukprot:TRINITY_DN80503_c0_g1_i1.p1 TRINITY_DN80503_c0_g1~~TRINITY_DN80503_c0_g1_i1.p1  ORF type:complete len:413 (-),score=101.99 TRINITY_DN80503_c0_g1_i1:231-1403(-)